MASSSSAASKPPNAPPVTFLPSWVRVAQPFVVGGIAGCVATTVVQPIDMVKVRLQLSGESLGHTKPPSAISMARMILQQEGPRGFYTGISAAYARQIVYGSARLGLFRTFSNWFKDLNGGGTVPAYQKVLAGMGAGALGSFIGNPTELSLIRMQADATLPPAERRNYRGIFDAVRRIVAEEGVVGLWKGSSPTVVRAMALNVAMLATSDEVKERLAPHCSVKTASVVSAFVAGVTAAVASLPFDMIKTRLQKQKPGADGSLRYRGFVHCARKIAAEEGFAAFYTGLGTYVTRIAPHSIVTLLVMDLLNHSLANYEARWAQRQLE